MGSCVKEIEAALQTSVEIATAYAINNEISDFDMEILVNRIFDILTRSAESQLIDCEESGASAKRNTEIICALFQSSPMGRVAVRSATLPRSAHARRNRVRGVLARVHRKRGMTKPF
jgi:hypothetical protein